MFYKKNPIYFIFWDTYICFQRIFRFKSFTYFYMYFLSTIWNDIDFHNWVYWCHLLVGWQKITCGLILLQEEAMSMSKPCQRWDSEIFSLEFTKNLTLSKGGGKRKSSMTSGTALSWPFSTSIVAMATNSWVPSSLLTYPELQIPQQSQERHNRDLLLHRECADMLYHCMVQGLYQSRGEQDSADHQHSSEDCGKGKLPMSNILNY